MDLELPKDFREFLRLLRAHGVEYLLIGGWAVGYHGYPRFTDDLDICFLKTIKSFALVLSPSESK